MVSVESLTTSQLLAATSLYWAAKMPIQVQTGPFVIAGHEYQIDPMSDLSKGKVYKKATQVGMTETEVLSSLHGMIYGHYPLGVMYIFPGDEDVSDFSKSRFGDLIARNPETIGQFVTGTDAAHIKRVGNSYLYLRHARLTTSIRHGEAKQSGRLRSAPVDKLVFDEYDLFDPGAEEQALGRIGASTVQEVVYLSNPTIPGYGIDAKFQKSDQRYWWSWCPRCNRHTTCLDLTFPDCIHSVNGKAFYACTKCGSEVDRRRGEWVAARPGAPFPGWHISRLLSRMADPADLLARWLNPETDLGNFKRMVLGLGHIDAQDRLTVQQVLACCGTDHMVDRDPGPTVMGVDVGKALHVVIGSKVNEKVHRLVWMGTVAEFEDLYGLGKRFNVQAAGLDFEPETRKAREFRQGAGYPVYLIDYVEEQQKQQVADLAEGIVKIGRTEICDATHDLVADHLLQLPRMNPAIEKFAEQVCATAKLVEDHPRTGRPAARYVKLGPDHYRHALNYFLQACKGIPDDRTRQRHRTTERDTSASRETARDLYNV